MITDTYGLWTVLGEGERTANNRRRLRCRCVCGTEKDVLLFALKSGGSTHCGKHPRGSHKFNSSDRLYQNWFAMLRRCHDPKHKAFEHYHRRGISVCPRWWDYDKFVEDMGPHPGDGFMLERKDNDKGYDPGNVKWATAIEQANNKINTRFETAYGKRQSRAMWARELNMKYNKLRYLLDRLGWTMEEILDNITRR